MHTFLRINSAADLNQLNKTLAPEFAPNEVAKKLEAGLSAAVKGILIEENYVDKDYRSTYYNFYSKKGLGYRKDCVRLHFFDGTVDFDAKALKLTHDPAYSSDVALTDHYFGYMVLRPTGINTIGRSVINADVRTGAQGRIITATHKVHLLGYTLLVQGFPWMEQHIDISICAHAACWAMLRHFSQRFPDYREQSLYEITMMAESRNPGGLIPSRGLKIQQAERILQVAGTFPLRIAKDVNKKRDDKSFYRQLAACIDSGFPVFAAMYEKRHAIAIVGYRWRKVTSPSTGDLRHAWDEIDSLIVIDDNQLPYVTIPTKGLHTTYTAEDIDTFLVPFPEKLFYPPQAVESLVPLLFNFGSFLQIPPPKEAIARYFITTGSALRRFVRNWESAFDPKLIEILMNVSFTQFIWVVELATESEWGVRQVSARAIIDATASVHERLPFWIFHSKDNVLVFERDEDGVNVGDKFYEHPLSGRGMTMMPRMETNLSAIVTK